MIQQIRANNLLPAATTEKLLLNNTPSLPSGVNVIIKFNGLPSADTVWKLTSDQYAYALLTDDGSYLVTDEGDYRAYVD